MNSPEGLKENTSNNQNQITTSPPVVAVGDPMMSQMHSPGSKTAPFAQQQQQQLIRIQPQQGQQVLQQNVVRVSPLTQSATQQPQTIVVIGGSPQRLQAQQSTSLVQTIQPSSSTSSDVKPIQEHGYAVNAVKTPLTHHDYALPKPQTQTSVESATASGQLIQLPGQQSQTLVTQQTTISQQHQPGAVQVVRQGQQTTGVQQLKPLTATLQGGQLVINQQQLIQGSQPNQPVTLRLQMKDISSLQRNVSKLQQPLPAKVTTVVRQAPPKQQAASMASQSQYIITNVSNSSQLQGVTGAQQIKIVPSTQVQQPQQHVVKQLPGGGFALTILPSTVVSSGTTVTKAVTIPTSPQSVRIIGSTQSLQSQSTVGSITAASSATACSSPNLSLSIAPTRMITKTITIPAGQQIFHPGVAVLSKSTSETTKLITKPTTAETIQAIASHTVTKALTVPAKLQTVHAVVSAQTSTPTVTVAPSMNAIRSVVPNQTVIQTPSISSTQQTGCATAAIQPTLSNVATSASAQTASISKTTTAATSQPSFTVTSVGKIKINRSSPATTQTGITASAALQKAAANITVSASPNQTASTVQVNSSSTKKLPNIIRSPTASQTSKTVKQTKAKAVTQHTTKTSAIKPIQIPGQAVGQQSGQILIMVNPGSSTLEEVQKIAQEVSKLKGQPRSAENVQKLKDLQARVRQLQNSVQTVRTKHNASGVPIQPVLVSVPGQQSTTQKGSSPSMQSETSKGEPSASGSSKREGKKHKLQEKANRIVAEAVARAKASGLQNIPKVMADVSLPEVNLDKEKKAKEKKKVKTKEPKVKKPPKQPKEKQPPKPKVVKKKARPKKVPPKKIPAAALVRLKNKRKHMNDSSSSGSEAEDALLVKALPDDDAYIEKRRSSRNTKRKRYDVAYEFNITDEDSSDSDKKDSDSNMEVDVVTVAPAVAPAQNESAKFFVENPDESEANLVEKILSSRISKKPQLPGEAQVGEIEEFYVKYRNFSYLHCEWATFDKLQRGDQRIHQKIKRFRAKQRAQPSFFTEPDDEMFNPDYIQVDRILDVAVTEDPDTKEKVTHYLVKWRSLPYEESTWELEEDVDDNVVQFFKTTLNPPPPSERERIDRADPDDWTKLEESPVYKGDNTLRDYQLEGVNWLMFSWCNGQNCILADEMGLGKTIQALAFIREVQKFGIQGPFLIIAPLSTIANWQREFETWTDINAVVYHGSAQSRHMIAEYEMYFKDSKGRRIPNIYKFQVFITTYEIVLADCQELSEIEWRVVVIDEAHRLKNRNCKLLEGLKFLDMEHRVLLTGTPLQNNIDELFSLLNFLEPGRFRSISQFLGDFGDLKTESQVEKLQQLLKPMMLRRLKEDVEKDLAEKEETIIEVELTNIQKKYYRAILERNFSFLSKGTTSSSNLPNLMNTMMELRKCCNHPFLINGAEEQIMAELAIQAMNLEMTQHMRALIQSSGKMVLLDKLLPRLHEGGHKVLIFSQMIRCLDILEDYLVQRRYPFERIDGRVRGNLRQAAIDRFSKPDSDRFVFLLCTRAGGLGINLTAADTCIIFDSDWNPQNDLQAQARCHRIGQTKSVKIYRLITRNSYEREMFDKASMKLGLDKAVLQSMRGENQSTPAQQQPFSKKEIEDLLRKGAYGAIMEDDDAASKFCEEDIEMILQRRTQVMKIEGGQKGSTFAKASFALPDDQRSDIKLDDPDFWAKWAKKAELDIEALKKRDSHVITEPRKRTQTRRFGNMDEMVEFTSNDEDSDDDQLTAPPKKTMHRKGHKGSTASGGASSLATPVVAMKPMKPCKNQLQSGWTRLECFRVEKGLLTYGWGRWEDILLTTRFKRPLGEKDIEAISRTMLIFCLKFYKGDENIKSFIWDLVTPAPDGSIKDYRNHKGLSAPVPRGRKSKKPKKEEDVVPAILEYDFSAKDQDPETLLTDQGYKNHLKRHCNKVLLRVRLLYYLKQEVIGEMMEKIAAGADVSELPLVMVQPEGDPPIAWWDEDADRSLLVGVFKHGYERYVAMRTDPTLCFLSRCGAPDKREIARENADNDDSQLDVESMETGAELEPGAELDIKPVIKQLREDCLEDGSLSPSSTRTSSPAPAKLKPEPEPTTMPVIPGKLPFPLAPDVNTRLRRLVAAYQRNHKRQQQKQAKRARREMVKQVRFEEQLRQRQLKKQENAQKWSRREEADFYRVLATFGVEQDPKTGEFDWSNFRKLAKLERKYDHRLLEYYQHFRAMCLRKCKREDEISEEFASLPLPDFTIEEISEERANKVLHRIDLLLKIRNEVLPHPELTARMRHCRKSLELPDWWEVGIHDRDLVIGVARYGINRMESQQQMLADPDLSFKDLKDKYPLMIPVPVPLPATVKTPAEPSQKGSNRTSNASPRPEDDMLRTSREALPKTQGEKENATSEMIEDSEYISNSQDAEKETEAVQQAKQVESDESGIEDGGNDETNIMNSQVKVTVSKDDNVFPSTQKSGTALLGDVSLNDEGKISKDYSDISTKSEDDKARDEPDCATDKITDNSNTDSPENEERNSLLNRSQSTEPKCTDLIQDMEYGSPRSLTAGDECSQRQTSEVTSASTNMTYAFLMKWPKDRVIVHRLENICHCVLKNCWPGRRQNHHNQEAKAQLAAVSKHQYDLDHKDLMQPGNEHLWDPSAVPPEHNYAGMADGLLALVHQRKRRRKRKLEPETELPSVADKSASESPLDLSQGSSRCHVQDAELGRPGLETVDREGSKSSHRPVNPIRRPSIEEIRRKKKKSYLKVKLKAMHSVQMMKSEDEHMQASAAKKKKKAKRLNLANFSDDDHVPVISRKTGDKLSGESAPLKKDLIAWLEANPDFVIQNQAHWSFSTPENLAATLATSEDSQEEIPGNSAATTTNNQMKTKRRRLRNPAKLDLNKITEEERVGIIEQETGRKLSAKLVPMLKNLGEWLEKHPGYNVGPDWAEIVKSKGNLPPELHSRIMLSPAKSTSPLIQPALYPAVLPTSQAYPSNHLTTSTDLSSKVSMQIGTGTLGGLALSGYHHPLGLGALPIGVAPIASLAGLEPPVQSKGNAKEKARKRKSTSPRKILSADQPVMSVSTPGTLAGISPFLLPSTAGMYYSPFLATQGLVPTSIPLDVTDMNGAKQKQVSSPRQADASDDEAEENEIGSEHDTDQAEKVKENK
ncbi:chromodomain-helicase-DNA-binding protein 8-like [Acanthaster planci]|uniref:Chromodomain-helicase-DNA-binding protein 8-like n=1 Tax=Acanthaster planci TaxID=133434 RepID=A0A8B7XQ90_ACAPL|nr:chromodomain-helicase-DNA-binding protein 8-like [Acanthaster planci]XP_022082170.1 chromodomain-helicase-DNA-binding protein 8-like [Acanthaster planci]